MHLIDTSVWVDFLRGTSHPKVDFLEALLEEGEAHLGEVTYAELCFGARDAKQFKKYSRYFSEMPFLPLPAHWHRKVGDLGFTLRRRGHKPFLADLMIACIALEHGVPLLTTDQDFRPFQDLFGLLLV